ncbi:MAG TPA: hypothetical protein VJ820_21620, partial [Propionibacteriaceae bacterium]|nr:hypothetical protein [Propionibacteriaceae bacterium]
VHLSVHRRRGGEVLLSLLALLHAAVELAEAEVASSSMEPFRSAKRTVTCLRSPSKAVLEVRMRSARCFGV